MATNPNQEDDYISDNFGDEYAND
jgi:hypothetical protein